MHHLIKNTIVRRSVKVFVALVVLIILLPFTLYIPFVQDIVKDYACDYASKETGMDISIERILLKFPLDLSVDGLKVVEATGDTMVRAKNFTAGVELKPLLDLNVKIGEARLENGLYHMVSNDSSSVITADIDYCRLVGTDIDLHNHVFNLLDGELRGGRVSIDNYPYKAVQEPDTAASTPWRVNAYKLHLADVDVTMSMLPTIDKLHAYVGEGTLRNSIVDTGDHTVKVGALALDSVDVRYLTLSETEAARYSKQHPLPPDTIWNPSDTVTWTITADSARLTKGHVLYALRNAKPKSGLDTDYLELTDANLFLSGVYNRGSEVALTIDQLTARERCGLEIKDCQGDLRLDSTRIDVTKLKLNTFLSNINLDAHVPLSLLNDKPSGKFLVSTDSKIALQEIALLSPALKTTMKMIPQYRPLALKGKVEGTPNHIDINTFTASIPNYLNATVKGSVDHPLDTKRLSGNLAFDAMFPNLNFVKPLFGQSLPKNVNFPPMTAKGHAKFCGNKYAGDVAMTVGKGHLVGKGSYNGSGEHYDVNAQLSDFPVRAILPGAPVDNITAHVKANGHGFDFTKASTTCIADVNLASIIYDKQQYRNVTANVNMNGGKVKAFVNSVNPNADLTLAVDGEIKGDRYIFAVDGNIRSLDAKSLGFTDYACDGTGKLTAFIDFNTKTFDCDCDADISNMNWNYDGTPIVTENTDLKFVSNDNTIVAYIENEETHLDFNADCSLHNFIKSLETSLAVMDKQIKARALDVSAIQDALPPFSLELKVGPSGVLPRYLQRYDIDVRDVNCVIKNDSSLYMDGYLHQFSVGETAIDTLSFHASELPNKYLQFNLHMGNRRGTWDDFAQVDIRGGAKDSTVDFLVEQRNIKKEIGYRLGVAATLSGYFVKCHFFPENPIISYHNWTINEDNYVNYNLHNNLVDADFLLKSDDSSFALHTEPTEDPGVENLLLKIDNLRLEQWVPDFPTLPKMAGVVNSDMKLLWNGKNVDGDADINIKDFVYENQKVGDVCMNTDFEFDPETSNTNINTTLDLDGSKVAMAFGSLSSDSTVASPFNMNVQLQRFPMSKATPFVPGGMLSFDGYLDGNIEVSGSTDSPKINGFLQGDSAMVMLPEYGCKLRLSNDKIPVNDGLVTFNKYRIFGINNVPVTMNGYFDFNTMNMDLSLSGKNVQLIGSQQESYSQVFGKGFFDVNATVLSKNDELNVKTKVTLLPTSNLIYVMQDDVTDLVSQVDENMVTFVNPTDSVQSPLILKTGAATTSSNINVDISIQEGAKIGAYLSPDGKDRAMVEGSGRLRYSLDFAGKDNMVGVFTILNGNVRYAPPVITQKNFDIKNGSTITWNGEVLNPVLNITGTESVRTSVQGSDGTSHVINFLVTAKIGNTLNNMSLLFDMTTDDDASVKNELQSMTETQRSNAAINLLLYNTYSGLNTTTDMNLTATGALYSFLQSQLNTWAANTLKGVDLSFGINEYGQGSESKQMSYSYRLSKTLFNDRFKIVVGGEYSTSASQDQVGNNLFNDISLEYDFNDAGTRYVHMFRHTGWESVLEGEITEMGVGFALKRTAPSFKTLLGLRRKRQNSVVLPADSVPADSVAMKKENETIKNDEKNEKK